MTTTATIQSTEATPGACFGFDPSSTLGQPSPSLSIESLGAHNAPAPNGALFEDRDSGQLVAHVYYWRVSSSGARDLMRTGKRAIALTAANR